MFPRSFDARVAQRMVVWGAILGFLLSLYALVELIQAHRMHAITVAGGPAVAAVAVHMAADGALARMATAARSGRSQASEADHQTVAESLAKAAATGPRAGLQRLVEEGRALLDRARAGEGAEGSAAVRGLAEKHAEIGTHLLHAMHGRHDTHDALVARDRRNKILIGLLLLFVLTQILVLEARWLVRPVVRMAKVLGGEDRSARALAAESLRRDEIGALARAARSASASASRCRDSDGTGRIGGSFSSTSTPILRSACSRRSRCTSAWRCRIT